jgi:hypothetical protein
MGARQHEEVTRRVSDRREKFVPLHTTDLIEFLAQHPALKPEEQVRFRQLAALIQSLLHNLYRQRHEQLTYVYSSLDPDRDTLLMQVPTVEHRDRLADETFKRLQDALQRANYQRLSATDIQQALQAASQWGVRMRVDFSTLQRLEVYSRGAVIGKRGRRSWRNWFREEMVDVPLFQRLVVAFRTCSDHDSPERFDSQKIYLRMFKNVPQQDVDMMLPASGIQMTWMDHSQIVLPSVYAMAMTLWRVLRNVVLLALFGIFKTVALIVVVLFALGFGIKSMFTYTANTRRRYLLNMAQSLYYQNLDNNAGVILRLLEDGEQQEACEAVLAYFVTAILFRGRRDISLAEIDAACEGLIQEATGVEIDFDIEAAARDLVHLGVVRMEKQHWTAMPLFEAVKQLDATWDSWFNA